MSDIIEEIFKEHMSNGLVSLESITVSDCPDSREVEGKSIKIVGLEWPGARKRDLCDYEAKLFWLGMMKGFEVARVVKQKISQHRSDFLQLHLQELLLELIWAFGDMGHSALGEKCSSLLEELKKEDQPWGTLAELVQTIREHVDSKAKEPKP